MIRKSILVKFVDFWTSEENKFDKGTPLRDGKGLSNTILNEDPSQLNQVLTCFKNGFRLNMWKADISIQPIDWLIVV